MTIRTARTAATATSPGTHANIDWHAMAYEAAFEPASRAIRILLRRDAGVVPAATSLNVDP